MSVIDTLRVGGVAVLLAVPAAAQDTDALTTAEEVRAEISEAMDAIGAYSAQERDDALAEARAVLDRLDDEIERRDRALRENWAEMSDAARETAESRLRELRQARNRLGERFGALQSGASSAWDELMTGFSNALGDFSDAWSARDEDAPDD